MLPYFMTENSDFAEVKNRRSVADIKKSPGNLDVAIMKVTINIKFLDFDKFGLLNNCFCNFEISNWIAKCNLL